MDQQTICDFSHIVANEVEIETNDDSTKAKNTQKDKRKEAIPFFEAADHSNGAIYDELNYCWSQTFSDIGQQPSIKWPFFNESNLICMTLLNIRRNSYSIARKCNVKKFES